MSKLPLMNVYQKIYNEPHAEMNIIKDVSLSKTISALRAGDLVEEHMTQFSANC